MSDLQRQERRHERLYQNVLAGRTERRTGFGNHGAMLFLHVSTKYSLRILERLFVTSENDFWVDCGKGPGPGASGPWSSCGKTDVIAKVGCRTQSETLPRGPHKTQADAESAAQVCYLMLKAEQVDALKTRLDELTKHHGSEGPEGRAI